MPTVTRTRTEAFAGARLRVGVGRVLEAHSRAPNALRRLRDEGDGAVHVGIVQTAATLVDGDDVRLRVVVDPGATLVLRDISATLAHPMRSGASWRLSVSVGEGARVVIAEQPLVVAAGARLSREVTIELETGARVVHRDTIVLGRHGEAGGAVRARTRVSRAGRPVLDDELDTSSVVAASSHAVLGSARVLASLSLFGCEAEPEGFTLASGDQLVRRLARFATELAELDALERRWRMAVLSGERGG